MPWTKKNRIAWMKCKNWIFLSPFSFACLETRIRRFETCMQIVVFCASQLVAFFVINSVSLKLNTSLLNISAPLSVAQSLACVLVPSFPRFSDLLDWYILFWWYVSVKSSLYFKRSFVHPVDVTCTIKSLHVLLHNWFNLCLYSCILKMFWDLGRGRKRGGG